MRTTCALDRSQPRDEQPEHRGDRRRFLIWALMLGVTTPEIVAARILRELETEDAG